MTEYEEGYEDGLRAGHIYRDERDAFRDAYYVLLNQVASQEALKPPPPIVIQMAPAAQKEEPVSMQWLAEMIMSDCGCSTNNQRLLDRIINRIDQYERANAAPAARTDGCTLCGFCAATGERITTAPAAREPYDKNEMNAFVQNLYDEKMREGKHGLYETLFHVVHKAIARANGIGKEQK